MSSVRQKLKQLIIFYECFYEKKLWCDIEELFLNEFEISIYLERKLVLFGKFL